MAEVVAALGVVASVAQLADFGFRLSVKLFTYSKAVASADTSIKDISNDVSLTSTVLKELCQILESDESRVVSEKAIEATSQTVKECMLVFEQLNDALDKSLANLDVSQSKGKAKRGMVALEKLKWPFKQNKMELLRSNLDRLKASLTLMLQVLSYARDISNRKAADSSFAYQKHLIESLARSEQETKHRYLALQKAIEDQKTGPVLNAFMNTSVQITGTKDMGIMSPPTDAEVPTTPVVHDRTIVGELLLCFQLLNDVLGYHMAISNLSKLSSMGYDQLRITLEKIHKKELNTLKEEFSAAPTYIKAEAAQNLENRLRELARAGYLKERKPAPREDASVTDSELYLAKIRQKHEEAFKSVQDEMEKELLNRERTQASDTELRNAIQAGIDITTGVMRHNINKVSQRGEPLDSLNDKTDNLSVSAQGFRRDANRVRAEQSLWAKAYRGVTQGVEIVGGVGVEGYKAVKTASGSVYDVATALLQANEDETTIPGPASPAGPPAQSANPVSEWSSNRRFSFDDDEDDVEAASGLEAMRMAEEQSTMAERHTAMGSDSEETLPQYSFVEDSDDVYKPLDLGLLRGGYEAHISYGGEEAKAESEDEDVVDDLLSQWTNLPSRQCTEAGNKALENQTNYEDFLDFLLNEAFTCSN